MHAIDRLLAISRSFGSSLAKEKLTLLSTIAATARIPLPALRKLHDCLCFMRAYPDSPQVLRSIVHLIEQLRDRVAALPDGEETRSIIDQGFPGSINRHQFSYQTVARMLRAFPGCFEAELGDMEDDAPLHNVLVLCVTNNECQGLDDINLSFTEWIDQSKPKSMNSRVEFIIRLLGDSNLGFQERAYIYDSCKIPIRYRLALPGTGRAELVRSPRQVHYQREDISRQRPQLEREIRRSMGKVPLQTPAVGEQIIDLAHAALASRSLEIAPLLYANANDVMLIECSDGLQVALLGVIPEYRDTLESAYFFLILRNGVPIGYGPASVCLGCCEMGINLFPEFRGAEIRKIYAKFMRCLHHALGVHYFYLTSYGMGEGNPAAIETGAFWFYRKLGFLADNPEVETLAQSEEKRMAKDPTYRSDRKILHQLSHTNAYFDMSAGTCRPLALGPIGILQSRFIGENFGGDRRLALGRCVSKVRKRLNISDYPSWSPTKQHALKLYAPLLCMIEDLETWSQRDRVGMLKIIHNKAVRSERTVDQLTRNHRRLRRSLQELGRSSPK